jgi:hypothetical protein
MLQWARDKRTHMDSHLHQPTTLVLEELERNSGEIRKLKYIR